MSSPTRPDLIVLGAGASGLVCAATAARLGLRVLCLDGQDRPARKVRLSGGGRCNYTNLGASPADYVCGNPHFVKSALARRSPRAAMDMLAPRGLTFHEEDNGRVFCDQGAGAVALALEAEAREQGVRLLLGTTIRAAWRDGQDFVVATQAGDLRAPILVLALGGPAWPRAGASDLGARLATSFGLPTTELRPGLVPLNAPAELAPFCRELSGLTLPARIKAERGEAQGSLLLTHRGLSGPAALDASLFWREGEELRIDFAPGADLPAALREHPRMELAKALGLSLPKRLALMLCQRLNLGGQVANVSNKALAKLDEAARAFVFRPSGCEGWGRAEVTLGGVDVKAVSSKTLEAKNVPGLFLCGEALDVTGRLGGYNLHWAWASGQAAGQGAADRLRALSA